MSTLSILTGDSLKARPNVIESFKTKRDSPGDLIGLEKLSPEYIAECNVSNPPLKLLTNRDTSNAPNQKPLSPASFIETGNHTFNDKTYQIKTKPYVEVEHGVDNMSLKNPVYCTTSKMLSENEMLITLSSLKHNEGSNIVDVEDDFSFIDQLDCENHVEIAPGTFELEYKRHTCEKDIHCTNSSNQNEETVTENLDPEWKGGYPNTTNTSVRLLSDSCLENENANKETMVQSRSDDLIIIENFVDVSNCNFGSPTMQCDDRVMIESEVDPFEKANQMKLDSRSHLEDKPATKKETVPLLKKKAFNFKKRSKIHRKIWDPKFNGVTKSNKNVKKKVVKVKRKIKPTGLAIIDLEKTKTSLNTKLTNPAVQTYGQKRKSVDLDTCQKLYQKLPFPDEQTESKEEDRNEFSVFEFRDEEDEKLKIEMEKVEKEMRALKERTCRYCNEAFNDPIDVLRHTRKFHTPRKVLVPKKDIEPLLGLKNTAHCPLCFVQIRNRYRSVYVKHMLTHVENSDIICKICGMKFKRKDNLQVHEKRHVTS